MKGNTEIYIYEHEGGWNKLINIAVCDDIEIYVKEIADVIYNEMDIWNGEIHILEFTKSRLLYEYIQENPMDIIFLDVEMPEMSGIDIAAYLRKEQNDHKTEIIFVTGTLEYDRELLNFQPFGFLEKPINREVLKNICQKYDVLNKNKRDEICVHRNGVLYHVFCDELMYIQKEGKNAVLYEYSKQETDYFLMRTTMKDMWSRLSHKEFVKVSSSLIVNMRYIKCIEKDVVYLINDQQFTISRRCAQGVRGNYAQYILRG